MPAMKTVSVSALFFLTLSFLINLTRPDAADNAAGQGFSHLEFKIVVEPADGQSFSVVLLAPSRQEKAAWTSDISQVKACTCREHVTDSPGAGLTSLVLVFLCRLSASTTSAVTA